MYTSLMVFLTAHNSHVSFYYNGEEIYWIWYEIGFLGQLLLAQTWMPIQSHPMTAFNCPIWPICTLTGQGCSVPLPPTPCIGSISSHMCITIFSRRRQSPHRIMVPRMLHSPGDRDLLILYTRTPPPSIAFFTSHSVLLGIHHGCFFASPAIISTSS